MEPLDVARGVVGERFPAAVAAFLGGSALTLYRTARSDLDVVVVLPGEFSPYRWTISAHGWPVELFVHHRDSLLQFWARDIAARRVPLLRMCAEGAILVGADRVDGADGVESADGADWVESADGAGGVDGIAEVIQAQARRLLAAGPAPATREELELRRYRLTNLLDDLEGRPDSAELAYVAAELLTEAAELTLLAAGRWLGAGKWLGRRLAEWDDDLAVRLIAGHRRAVAEGELDPLRAVIDDVLNRVGGRLGEGYRAVAPTVPPVP